MQSVILAGGKGTRLAARLNGRPKPLIEIGGVPLLERQLRQLAAGGVSAAVVLVNHEAAQIEAFIAERDWGPLRVSLIDDGEPRGTAGAVLACLDRLEDSFLVVYGDTLFDIDIPAFSAAHDRSGGDATLFLHPNDHPADSDLVEVDEEGRILAFHGYPHPPGAWLPNLVNAAFYRLERRALEPYRELLAPIDFAKDLFPRMLADAAQLVGYRSFEYIKDVGTPARVDKAEAHLRSGVVARSRLDQPQVAVFLDRDGTLNELRDYVRSPDDLVLSPGAAEAVRRLNQHELRAVVVTNQPVLARGECTPEGLRAIHAKLDTELGRSGAWLDALYVCPHHPHGGYPGEVPSLKVDCECRKPKTGLIERAAAELNIDLRRSWLIGDSTTDMLAARRSGLRSILVQTGEGGRDGRCFAEPDFVAKDIGAAVALVTEVYPLLVRRLAGVLGGLAPGELVVVGGFARSGKSTLAAALAAEARQAGMAAQRLSLDRWIRPLGAREPGLRGRHDLAGAAEALRPWLAGRSAEFDAPVYDRWSRSAADLAPFQISADAILILDGVSSFCLPVATSRRMLRLYVEADEPARAERVIADLVARGASPVEARRLYEARRQDENPMIERARASADLVISLDDVLGRMLETAP
jgi:histidinol-phosphate phosphatase family protein